MGVMFLDYMQLTIFSPTHIAVRFALLCKLSPTSVTPVVTP